MGKLFITIAVVVTTAWLPSVARAELDMVFLLDTTGSMSGEIREAKERVRQLVAAISESRPGERIRVGVVAYRDRGDEYVTRVTDFTTDVDQSFTFLAGLRAGGGGDGPEDVLSGMASALGDLRWDESASVERQIFLIGDAPPHLDYSGHHDPKRLLAEARRRRIVINTIGCRSLPAEGVAFFRKVAYATEGSYQHIGRVRADAPGLAETMLEMLEPAPEPRAPAPSVPIDAKETKRFEEAVGTGLLVRPGMWTGRSFRPSGCHVTVLLPPGFGLAQDPRFATGDAALAVTLALTQAAGGVRVFELETCVEPTTPIRVSFGG